MKKMFFLVVLTTFLFASCEEIDVRDEIIGEWNASVSGSVNMMMEGQVFEQIPMSVEDKLTISKVEKTEDGLLIDDLPCTIKGSTLVFEDQVENSTEEGVQMNTTVKRTGTIEKDKITITETYSGSWSVSIVMTFSGTISGTNVITLTR